MCGGVELSWLPVSPSSMLWFGENRACGGQLIRCLGTSVWYILYVLVSEHMYTGSDHVHGV